MDERSSLNWVPFDSPRFHALASRGCDELLFALDAKGVAGQSCVVVAAGC